MKIMVTGSTGKVGRATIDRLLEEGHQVFAVDAVAPAKPKCKFTKIDMTDFGQVLESVMGIDSAHSGLDAIVHLAAIPGASHAPNATIYHTNTSISFNVFQAARAAGIKNVVFASSETLLGVPFETPPPYFPVDEEVPNRPETAYSLSKHVEETIAKEFARWVPDMKLIGLRFSWVKEPAEYANFHKVDENPDSQKWNFWSYVDSRDCAQAISLALNSNLVGFHKFVVAADDTAMTKTNAELIAQYYPDVPLKADVGKHDSLLSSQKVKDVLGFKPEYRWRDQA